MLGHLGARVDRPPGEGHAVRMHEAAMEAGKDLRARTGRRVCGASANPPCPRRLRRSVTSRSNEPASVIVSAAAAPAMLLVEAQRAVVADGAGDPADAHARGREPRLAVGEEPRGEPGAARRRGDVELVDARRRWRRRGRAARPADPATRSASPRSRRRSRKLSDVRSATSAGGTRPSWASCQPASQSRASAGNSSGVARERGVTRRCRRRSGRRSGASAGRRRPAPTGRSCRSCPCRGRAPCRCRWRGSA